jgi:hypothetical protein
VPPAKSSRSQHGPSFLRWAGSKRKSLALLASTYVHNDYQYVEPFAGSAALFFSLQPASAVLGDLNGHLVNAMRCVRDDPDTVHLHLTKIPRDEATYYSMRAKFNLLRPYGIRAAVLFIYLNRNCFNGLWRTNLAGDFNVPFGGDEMGGKGLLDFVDQIGRAFEDRLIKGPFVTDYVGTFVLDANVTEPVEAAVGKALNAGAIVHVPHPGSGPDAVLRGLRGQRFRLSYALAARYRLLLTLGDRVNLSKLLLEMRGVHLDNTQKMLFEDGTDDQK